MADDEALVDDLIIASTLAEIPAALQLVPVKVPMLGDQDVKALATIASGLALSDDPGDRRKAFEIASRLLQIAKNRGVAVACQAILGRLGNFPGVALLSQHSDAGRAPRMAEWEQRAHKAVNTVEIGKGRRRWVLTDFQKKIFDSLRGEFNVSFSGPTSSGKSFVLALDLVHRIFDSKAVVVYLVPTRALIREVMMRVRRNLEEHEIDVPVRSIPVPLKPEQARNGAVFVLTQERLLTLMFSSEGKQAIDVLVVDEAQSLGENARGVVLHSAIDTAVTLNPDLQVFFGSPLASNPGLMVQLFMNRRGRMGFLDTVSPVTQNLIVVNRIKRKPDQASVTLLHGGRTLDLGTAQLPFPVDAGLVRKRAGLAVLVTEQDDATIVYANGRAEAEDIAEEIAASLQEPEPAGPEIREAVRFLRDHIHPKYPLNGLLPRGVAVHYGSMPGIVRNVVEDLFRGRRIRFIVTTSTLLQGVNLPARNIIIHNPRRGNLRPMTSADFRNLAGRAGRLSHEFHGNVWILHPHQWEEPSHEGPELNPMESALDKAMTDGGSIVVRALDEAPLKKESDYGIATLGKLYNEFGPHGGSLVESRFLTVANAEQIHETERRLKATTVTVSSDVLRRNSTMHPVRLDKLAGWMREQDVAALLPLHPKRPGAYDRFLGIAKITARLLEKDDSESYVYYTFLANLWMSSTPLRLILERQLVRKRADPYNADASDGRLLTDILHEIEEEVRYTLVRNMRAYADILRAELDRRGQGHLAEKIPPLHLFLESGSSSEAELNLISLGLSRTTAIMLAKHPAFREEQTPEETLAVLRGLSLGSLDLPAACLAEIRSFTGAR